MSFEAADIAIRLIQVVIVPVTGYGAWVLRDIRDQLRRMNGRVLVSETWREDHTKQDDERHRKLEADMERLDQRVYDVRLP